MFYNIFLFFFFFTAFRLHLLETYFQFEKIVKMAFSALDFGILLPKICFFQKFFVPLHPNATFCSHIYLSPR